MTLGIFIDTLIVVFWIFSLILLWSELFRVCTLPRKILRCFQTFEMHVCCLLVCRLVKHKLRISLFYILSLMLVLIVRQIVRGCQNWILLMISEKVVRSVYYLVFIFEFGRDLFLLLLFKFEDLEIIYSTWQLLVEKCVGIGRFLNLKQALSFWFLRIFR